MIKNWLLKVKTLTGRQLRRFGSWMLALIIGAALRRLTGERGIKTSATSRQKGRKYVKNKSD